MSIDYLPEAIALWGSGSHVTRVVEAWKPQPLAHDAWPPDYRAVYAWRVKHLTALRASPVMLEAALRYYSTRPEEFIMHWCDTYDPRRPIKWMPFVFFIRQSEFIKFIHELRKDQQSGLVEKARDMGATWLACGYSVWSWLFIPNDAIGWGSRKQDLVDRLGDADSIFEKMRLIVRRLPDVFIPDGFIWSKHSALLKLINPSNGATITGEAGDDIGRGGRKSMVFKDESAHYERPEKIEAALGDNTNVQVDISSVNGLGNVFHRRRESGIEWAAGRTIEPGFVRVFVIDWRDHPTKTQEWYDTRKAKYVREGMAHIFAQEVDRNYSAAVDNTIIDIQWLQACVDAHCRVPYLSRPPEQLPNLWLGGLDVADEGADRNAFALRQWIILRSVEEWGERDVGVTTRRTIAACRERRGVRVFYDSVGIGAGVKAEYNRLIADKFVTYQQTGFFPWNAGSSVQKPFDRIVPDDDNSPRNQEAFVNLKAQAWWSFRTRCYKTFKAVTDGAIYPADELVSFDSTIPKLHSLIKELAQPTHGSNGSLKTLVNKKPPGTKSPNLADAVIMAYFPLDDAGPVLVGRYGA